MLIRLVNRAKSVTNFQSGSIAFTGC